MQDDRLEDELLGLNKKPEADKILSLMQHVIKGVNKQLKPYNRAVTASLGLPVMFSYGHAGFVVNVPLFFDIDGNIVDVGHISPEGQNVLQETINECTKACKAAFNIGIVSNTNIINPNGGR